MPQSLHVLAVHIIFSTMERCPWLTIEIREPVWAYHPAKSRMSCHYGGRSGRPRSCAVSHHKKACSDEGANDHLNMKTISWRWLVLAACVLALCAQAPSLAGANFAPAVTNGYITAV